MKSLKNSKTYVEFLLEKGADFSLQTIFDNQENSDLLKEFSFKLIEDEMTLGDTLDLLKSQNVSLPDTRYLNESHEEKIYHLGLSLYTSLYMENSIKELKDKSKELGVLSTEIEAIGSMDDIKEIREKIEDNESKLKELSAYRKDNFLSILNSPDKIDAFILGDTTPEEPHQKVSVEQQEKAKKIIKELSGDENSGIVESFVSAVRGAIDRVDSLIGKCKTILDSHDISADMENKQIDSALNTKDVHNKTEQTLPSNTQKVETTDSRTIEQIAEDIRNKSKEVMQREEIIGSLLDVKLAHLQDPFMQRVLEKPSVEVLKLMSEQGDENVYGGDLFKEQTIFGIKDTLQPINELVASIKESDLFSSYMAYEEVEQQVSKEPIKTNLTNTPSKKIPKKEELQGVKEDGFTSDIFLKMTEENNLKAREDNESLKDNDYAQNIER